MRASIPARSSDGSCAGSFSTALSTLSASTLPSLRSAKAALEGSARRAGSDTTRTAANGSPRARAALAGCNVRLHVHRRSTPANEARALARNIHDQAIDARDVSAQRARQPRSDCIRPRRIDRPFPVLVEDRARDHAGAGFEQRIERARDAEAHDCGDAGCDRVFDPGFQNVTVASAADGDHPRSAGDSRLSGKAGYREDGALHVDQD